MVFHKKHPSRVSKRGARHKKSVEGLCQPQSLTGLSLNTSDDLIGRIREATIADEFLEGFFASSSFILQTALHSSLAVFPPFVVSHNISS